MAIKSIQNFEDKRVEWQQNQANKNLNPIWVKCKIKSNKVLKWWQNQIQLKLNFIGVMMDGNEIDAS